MEVRIAVQQSVRDVVLHVDETAETLTARIAKATKNGELLTITDHRGHAVVLHPDKIAFIELGPQEERRVGFGAE